MWRIPLSDMNFDHRESAAVHQVLEDGWLTMGPRTRQFEDAFAEKHSAEAAVAVMNCTCALELVYRYIFALNPDRRCIVVPDITFVATANAVISAGGIPLLCDIESEINPFLSASALEKLLGERNDIAAVVLVHYAGYDAGADTVADLCRRYNVHLVEDCAHAPAGTTVNGRRLGNLGFAGCFSFFSNKNLATGEGGMIVTNDSGLYNYATSARNHGLTSGTHFRHTTQSSTYDVTFPGHNYRCTEITAALGLVQLEKLEVSNEVRRELTELYFSQLQDTEGVRPVFQASGTTAHSDCHIMPVLFDDIQLRNKAMEALNKAGIQTSHHYRAIHTFSWYQDRPQHVPQSLQFSEHFSQRELTLPLHPRLGEAAVLEICQTIRTALA